MRLVRLALAAAFFSVLMSFGLATGRVVAADPSATQPSSTIGSADSPAKHEMTRLEHRAVGYLKALGTPCTLINAADRSDAHIEKIEVYCEEGRGFIVVGSNGKAGGEYDCILARQNPTPCTLPENRHPEAGLKPFLSDIDLTCEPVAARYLIPNSDQMNSLYEVSCADGSDYLLNIPDYMLYDIKKIESNFKLQAVSCLENAKLCIFSGHQQQVASLKFAIQGQLTIQCDITNARYVGMIRNLDVFELYCGGNPGQFVELTDKQKIVNSLPCSRGAEIGVRCETDLSSPVN